MDILLIGEFSSYHRYLKQGLQSLNHNVTLISNGDGWKKIGDSDRVLYRKDTSGLRGLYDRYVSPFIMNSKLKKYDVIQFVNPLLYPCLVNKAMLLQLSNHGRIVSLAATGSDYALMRAYLDGKFEYSVFDDDKSFFEVYNHRKVKGKLWLNSEKKLISRVDVIIPTMYEYACGYKSNPKLAGVIPLPVNCDEINYIPNRIDGKIVFYHGLNREAEKGTKYIVKALERLKEKYPNDVEIIVKGHMPFNEYYEIVKKSNVIIDQCMDYSYGINACIGMAQGKVVMAGNRSESRDALNVKESPIINITPSSEQIYSQLEYIIDRKGDLEEMGLNSRKYCEKTHDCKKVALKYLEAWRAIDDLPVKSTS